MGMRRAVPPPGGTPMAPSAHAVGAPDRTLGPKVVREALGAKGRSRG
jgi:hypothetical protein